MKILEEISKMHSATNQPLYISLLNTPHSHLGFSSYTLVMIPPYLEKMLNFILFEVNHTQYNWYANFILKTFKITQTDCDKTLFTDITRYLITNFEYEPRHYKTPRWILVGFILKNIRNEIISAEVKQALFFDWLFFNK